MAEKFGFKPSQHRQSSEPGSKANLSAFPKTAETEAPETSKADMTQLIVGQNDELLTFESNPGELPQLALDLMHFPPDFSPNEGFANENVEAQINNLTQQTFKNDEELEVGEFIP